MKITQKSLQEYLSYDPETGLARKQAVKRYGFHENHGGLK